MEIPDGWQKGRVDNFIKLQRGFDLTKKNSIEGSYPVYSSSGISYYHNAFKVESPGIVTGRKGSVGPVYYITEKFWPHDTSLWVSDFKNNLPKYIWYFLQSLKLERFDESSSVPTLNRNNVHRIKVVFPPLAEQRRIAEILGTWDRAIAATEALIAKSEVQKKALMQQLLTGKRCLPGFEGEWKEVRLGEVANCLDRKRIPLNGAQRSEKQGVVPYYGANGVVDYIDNHIFDQDLVLLAEDGGYFDEFATRPIAQFITGKSWVNNHAHILEAKKQTTEKWLYYLLVHKNIMAFVNAGTRAKLNKSDMLSIPILMPEKDEQNKIIEILDGATSESNKLKSRLKILKTEKAALMQQLLTGKRRVKLTEEAA